MTAIVIDTITIRQDSEGRFCLNDLHKAAGGDPNHQPAFFLRRAETTQLINKLNSANSQIKSVASERGRYGGTFVCKELVYEYAMWISPEFKLKVIEAYDRLATKESMDRRLALGAFIYPLPTSHCKRGLSHRKAIWFTMPASELVDAAVGQKLSFNALFTPTG